MTGTEVSVDDCGSLFSARVLAARILQLTLFHNNCKVYRQPGMDVAGLAGFKPPYGKATAKTLAKELKK